MRTGRQAKGQIIKNLERATHGGNDQSVEVLHSGDEEVDEGGGDEPADEHDGSEEEDQASPVLPDVGFGKLDADGKDGQGDDDSGDFEGDAVGVAAAAPCGGGEDVGAVGTEAGGGDTVSLKERRAKKKEEDRSMGQRTQCRHRWQ